MLVVDEQNQPSTEGNKKFWQYQHFFHHLFVNFLISITLVLGTIVWLFFTASLWENALFPGMRKIDPLQRDLAIVQAKVEQIQHSVQQMNEKGAEIETLKGQITALQQAVVSLEKVKMSSQPVSSDAGALLEKDPQNLRGLWQKAKTCLQGSDICEMALTEFKSKLPASALLEQTLKPLLISAQTSVKTVSMLQDDLEKIYQNLKQSDFQETVAVKKSHSWGQSLWHYFSKWVQIRRLDAPEATETVLVVSVIEQALQEWKKNQWLAAMERLQPLSHLPSLKKWLEEARPRQQREQALLDFDKSLGVVMMEGATS